MPTRGPELGFFRSFIATADGVCSVVSLVCKYIMELLITTQIEVEQLTKQTQSEIKDTHTHNQRTGLSLFFPRKNHKNENFPVFCRVQTENILRLLYNEDDCEWMIQVSSLLWKKACTLCLFVSLAQRLRSRVCVLGSLLILFKSELGCFSRLMM